MELTFMEISEAEMKMLIEKRKQAAKQAAIQAKAEEICKLIKELEALGGHVHAHRSGKNRYLQTGYNVLYNVQAGAWGLDFKV